MKFIDLSSYIYEDVIFSDLVEVNKLFDVRFIHVNKLNNSFFNVRKRIVYNYSIFFIFDLYYLIKYPVDPAGISFLS